MALLDKMKAGLARRGSLLSVRAFPLSSVVAWFHWFLRFCYTRPVTILGLAAIGSV